MEKDHRYKTVKVMIEARHVTEFKHMFTHVPKSVMAHDLGTNNNRMSRLIAHVQQFSIEELTKISRLLEVELDVVLKLVSTQLENEKRSKKKASEL